jgi:hypothetical protein
MSKIASIFACSLLASIFSFDAQALPASASPAQVGAPEVTPVRDFCGLGFHRDPTAPVCPTAFPMAM